MNQQDDALETLLLPFSSGQLQWSNDGLFLRARYGPSLQQLAISNLLCEQSFRPEADALKRAGLNVSPAFESQSDSKKFSLILVLPPRQRDEARALFARALDLLKPDGRVIASVPNNEGARSLENDLEQLAGNINTSSKNKCRVFWAAGENRINKTLLSQWRDLDKERPIANGRFISRPGVFAWDRIDVASELLARHLPVGLCGSAADLGSGFGYLSAELLQKCSGITSLDCYEAEYRALQLSKSNLAIHESRLPVQYHWHDVTSGLLNKYDVIITNPPFHTHSRTDRPDIGRRFIAVAAESLNPKGQLWLVANRHLPYEEVLSEGFDKVNVVAQQQGFKIIAATKAAPAFSRKARQ